MGKVDGRIYFFNTSIYGYNEVMEMDEYTCMRLCDEDRGCNSLELSDYVTMYNDGEALPTPARTFIRIF